MAIYTRDDSIFWWMHLEGTKTRTSTGVLHCADQDTARRKEQRQLAQDVYHRAMNALATDKHDLPSRDTTQARTFQPVSEWYETHYAAKKKGLEREQYALKPLRRFFGRLAITAITPAAVKEYATTRLTDDEVTASNVNREIDVLKAVLKAAVEKRWLKFSPLVGMKRLRTVKRRKRVLTQAEEDRLLTALQPADRALWVVAVDTLLRLSNVLNLKRADHKGAYLDLVDSKTGPYQVRLSARARQALDSLPKDDNEEYFFAHRRTAEKDRDRRGVIRRLIQRACAKAKIPYGRAVGGVTFHTGTRASGATRMIRAGVDARTVQAIGNWKSFQQMGEYLQPDTKGMQQAVNRIGAGSTVDMTKRVFTSGSRQKPDRAKKQAKSA